MQIEWADFPAWLWNLANTLIAGFAAFWAVRASRKIESTNRPSVVFRDYENECKQVMDTMFLYSFQLVNTGSREAINVTIPKEYIDRYPFLSQWETIRRELAANGGCTTCVRGPKRFSQEITELTILYEDTNGNRFSTKYKDGRFSFGKDTK